MEAQTIIVNDASCLVDLQNIGILEIYAQLDCRLIIPDLIVHELRDIGEDRLLSLGFEVFILEAEGIQEVIKIRRDFNGLSSPDAFALIVASQISNAILLTGDKALRKAARTRKVAVHGLLWAIEKMYDERLLETVNVVDALEQINEDSSIRLPKALKTSYLEKYKGLL